MKSSQLASKNSSEKQRARITPVRILDDQVVNQIAAGEVVERPVSVVKELVENAIDAGADEISVTIANGGRSHIEVADNGFGMNRDDALLAIERFGTSKIRSIEDLSGISSLGFRGEALPSIASVSRFLLQSRRREGEGVGVEIEISGGKLRDVREVALAPGTRVIVRNLFFNVPARRKFLRAESTEASLVKALIGDFAVAFPSIRFALTSDGANVVTYPKASGFRERVQQLKLVRGQAIVVEHSLGAEEGRIFIRAVLSSPINSVASSGRLRLIVNSRTVRDALLLRAVRTGFGSFLKSGRYPTGVVALDLPAEEVDVNVHPQKTEVRFRNSQGVFQFVSQSIASSLAAERPEGAREVNSSSTHAAQVSPEFFGSSGFSSNFGESTSYQGSKETRGAHVLPMFSTSRPSLAEGSSLERKSPSARLSEWRFVGQVLHLYLILEGETGVALVDMHAAHERVTFFQLKKQFLEGEIASQLALLPETIDLPPERFEQFERYREGLRNFGVDAEPFGDDRIVVRALPAILRNASASKIFADLFSLPAEKDWAAFVESHADAFLIRMACHGSVRSGRDLKREEVYELLELLELADAAAFCPHGRPVSIMLTKTELETMFGRIA